MTYQFEISSRRTEIPSSIESDSAPVLATGELHNINNSYRMNGRNYLQWSQIVKTFLKGKGKLSHLDGTGPKFDHPKFGAWDEDRDGKILDSGLAPRILPQ